MSVRGHSGAVGATQQALRDEQAYRRAAAALDFPEAIPDGWARRHLLPFILRGFPAYQAGWFHRELAETMEWFSREIAAGRSPRLIVTVPPRHGKSEIVSRRWPIWHLGKFPDHELVVASYGQSLANDMSRDARSVRADVLDLFPGLAPDENGKDGVEKWEISGGRGSYKAVGVGGPLTGSGAHALIIDDPVKDRVEADSPVYRERAWQWYQTVASTRLAPGAGVLVMMTRWHEDDLVGRLLAEEKKGGDQWRKVDFPAIAEQDEEHRRTGEALHPERYPIEVLEQRRKVLGSRNFAALFQQRPTPATGGLFRRGWFQLYDTDPRNLVIQRPIITCDLTFKGSDGSDYVVFGMWGRRGEDIYLLDRFRARLDYVETKVALRAFVAKWRHLHPRVLVELKANGEALVADLRSVVPNLIGWVPDSHGSKETRAAVAAARAEAGQLWVPASAPWLEEWIEEHVGFPAAKHDDQVDVTSMAVIYYSDGGGAQEATEQMAAMVAVLEGRAPPKPKEEPVGDEAFREELLAAMRG